MESGAPAGGGCFRFQQPREFTIPELAAAVEDFAKLSWFRPDDGRSQVVISRAIWKDSGREVVVERTSTQNAGPISTSFRSDAAIAGRLRHKNLLQLHGWCHDRDSGTMFVLREPVAGGNLHQRLHSPEPPPPADVRFAIARGLAAAVHYLNSEAEIHTSHLEIDSKNVLLDGGSAVKLTNYGAGKWISQPNHAWMMGSAMCKAVYTTSNTHRLGVVLLEIATGKDSGKVDVWRLVRGFHSKGSILDAADERLGRDFDGEKMERLLLVGLACAQPIQKHRPSTKQVVDYLDFKSPVGSDQIRIGLLPDPITNSPPPEKPDTGSMKEFEIHILKNVVSGLRQIVEAGVQLDRVSDFANKYTQVLTAMGVPLEKWNALAQEALANTRLIDQLKAEIGEENDDLGGRDLASLKEDIEQLGDGIEQDEERMRQLQQKHDWSEKKQTRLQKQISELEKQAAEEHRKCSSIREELAVVAERKGEETRRRDRKKKEYAVLQLTQATLHKISSFSLDL